MFVYLLNLQADDTYVQLKKDLEYLDLKVGHGDRVQDIVLVLLFSLAFFVLTNGAAHSVSPQP